MLVYYNGKFIWHVKYQLVIKYKEEKEWYRIENYNLN